MDEDGQEGSTRHERREIHLCSVDMKEERYISVQFWHIMNPTYDAGRDAFRPVSGIMYPFPRTNVMRTRWCQENRHMIRALSDAGRRDVKALIVAWNNEQPLLSVL